MSNQLISASLVYSDSITQIATAVFKAEANFSGDQRCRWHMRPRGFSYLVQKGCFIEQAGTTVTAINRFSRATKV